MTSGKLFNHKRQPLCNPGVRRFCVSSRLGILSSAGFDGTVTESMDGIVMEQQALAPSS
jgi:hypothetical protein